MKKAKVLFRLRLKSDIQLAKGSRRDWSGLKPTTRVVESKRRYRRNDKSWKTDVPCGGLRPLHIFLVCS